MNWFETCFDRRNQPSNEKMAVFINFYVKRASFLFSVNFFETLVWNLILHHELSVFRHQFVLPDNDTINSVKSIKKSQFESNSSNRKVDNVIFEERTNRPWSMLGTWLRYLVRLVKCCFFRYVVNAYVYSSNE